MAADFQNIVNAIDDAIATFVEQIPAAQTSMMRAVDEQLRKLDLKDGKIKPTINNLKIISNIKNKLLKVILTDKYKAQVKDFIKAFDTITSLQNDYWRSVEKSFKPTSILKEIKKVTIDDTVTKLMDAGIDANVAQPVKDMLTRNITSGGSYEDLTDQLRESLITTDSEGLLGRYAKQIAIDSVNQYSRNYTQTVSSDLGYEWYGYRNTLIKTSRAFCKAMHERRYFHVSEIPALLKAKGLYYTDKDGKSRKVPLNKKTKLPDGMYTDTNESNFLTLLGGYTCGHQAGPVSDFLVKSQAPELYAEVTNGSAYKRWKAAHK